MELLGVLSYVLATINPPKQVGRHHKPIAKKRGRRRK